VAVLVVSQAAESASSIDVALLEIELYLDQNFHENVRIGYRSGIVDRVTHGEFSPFAQDL